MIARDTVQSIGSHLFADKAVNVFAVLDGASVPDLLDMLFSHEPDYTCLYRGQLKPDLAEVAPYLVRLAPDSEFTRWVIERGWGNHWGILAITDVDTPTLRRHLRRFLIVYDSDGKPLYFRYYDPRVLRVYLPTCNAEELATVFGPVACYVLEDEDPTVGLRFRSDSGSLQTEKMQLAESAYR